MLMTKKTPLILLCLLGSALYAQARNEEQPACNFNLGGGKLADLQVWQGVDIGASSDPFVKANMGKGFFNLANNLSNSPLIDSSHQGTLAPLAVYQF